MPFTVLVVDDQPLEGEMIALVLKRDRPDAVYVGQALDAADGIRMASLLNPGLIFLDIKMPGMNGLTAISHLHRASPGVHIVMLTAFDDFEFLRTALRAGARDYLLKPVRPADILSALDRLDAPAVPLPPAEVPLPSPDQLWSRLRQAIHGGDPEQAQQAVRACLSYYGPLDQRTLIYTCVRCMEFASALACSASAVQSVDGLRFLYQEFVLEVSSLKNPDLLEPAFANYAQKAADIFSHSAGDTSYRQIAAAKQYINEHFHEPLQMSEVAGKLYLSTAYFSRLFKEKIGMTFSDYLASCRVERARQLLATTDLSISEVANAIGYQEANSFSRLFKTRTGQSPSEYRASRMRNPG